MWPFRPTRLGELFGDEEIAALLALGDAIGSAVTFIEAREESGGDRQAGASGTVPLDAFHAIHGDPGREARRPDPFCTFLRHGSVDGAPAFRGADEACALCELRLARAVLRPDPGMAGKVPESRRCHMGLTDFQVPVEVGGRLLGVVIAGRSVAEDVERERVRKIVGRLGASPGEASSLAPGDHRAIEPANERARKRLLGEIASIPVASEALRARLADLAARLGELAERQFRVERRRLEEELLLRVDQWPRHRPGSFRELGRETSALLELLRGRLGVEFIALFARTPRELDGESAPLSLVAEAGLDGAARRRVMELEWGRVAPPPASVEDAAGRGRELVSSLVGALHPTGEAPRDLKDRLTGGIFLAPVEVGPGRESALVFGPAMGDVEPETEDLALLARLAAGTARRYYAMALETDRGRLLERLERREERLRAVESELAELRAAEKRAREMKGFSRFDVSKLLRSRVESAAERAAAAGIEIDARALPDRLPLTANRGLLGEAIDRLIEAGIARTSVPDDSARPPPLRVFLRRGRRGVSLGVEAIGELRPAGERGAGGDPADGPADDLAIVSRAASRHRGRLRVERERLRRSTRDPAQWIGQTTFLLELPASREPGAPSAGPSRGRRPGK